MTRWLLTLVMLSALAVPIAGAQTSEIPVYDFNGQALLPNGTGDFLTLYSIMTNNGVIPTPIPLDFDNHEYTVVVKLCELMVDDFTQQYGGGTVTIYEDGATPADYANPSSFDDGTAILIGSIASLSRTLFSSTGTAAGSFDWSGGSRLGEVPVEERNDWAILSGLNNMSSTTIEGYDENWDGKLEFPNAISNDKTSWGSVKKDYEGENE